jgi:hypothetical protein
MGPQCASRRRWLDPSRGVMSTPPITSAPPPGAPLGDRDDLTGRHGAETEAFDDAQSLDMALASFTGFLGRKCVIDREVVWMSQEV